MRRPTLLLAVIVAVAVTAYAGYRMLVSDETRIRWLLEDAASSFNQAHLRSCLEAFHLDYRDTTTGLERARLGHVLRLLFLRDLDPKTKAFLFRVRLPTEDLAIQVDDNGEQAEARFQLDLEKKRQEAWQSQWQVWVTAKLQKVDGEWRIHRSSHETAAGRPPR